MLISQADARIVEWARARHYPCLYHSEAGLPSPCLKVHLGQVAAFFHHGRLARLSLQVDGELIQDACEKLQELLAACAGIDAYPPQQPIRHLPVRESCFSRN
ncbi:MAG: hypothetical protein JXB13_18795 [Phycisphaerae bacterium]|nr:hypothetical protein [Phycisphaerae bacterium]